MTGKKMATTLYINFQFHQIYKVHCNYKIYLKSYRALPL